MIMIIFVNANIIFLFPNTLRNITRASRILLQGCHIKLGFLGLGPQTILVILHLYLFLYFISLLFATIIMVKKISESDSAYCDRRYRIVAVCHTHAPC